MSRPSASRTDPRRIDILVGLAAFALALLLSPLGFWGDAERGFLDLLWRTKTALFPAELSPRICPVDLNDRAERNLGSAVDSREAFAVLLNVMADGNLAGAMDFLFMGSRNEAGDKALAEAASRLRGLVTAIVPVDRGVTTFSGQELLPDEKAPLRARLWYPEVRNAGSIPVADTFLMPNLSLAKASSHLGHIGVRPDADGIYRKTPLFFRWEDGYVPSLSLALAAQALRVDPAKIVVDAGRAVTLPTREGEVSIPIDASGYAWIPYPASWVDTWRRTPLDKVVAMAKDPDKETELLDLWSDGLVLAADLTTSHKDFGPTPIDSIYPLSGIHTRLLNGILTGKLIRSAAPLAVAAEILVLALALGLLALGRRARAWNAGAALVLLALVAWGLVQWFLLGTVPFLVAPAAAWFLAWVAVSLLRLYRNHQERVLLENALSRYLPRALATRVLDERRVELKPSEKELTVLFSDISGFTRWSSDKEPEKVHAFLSEYLSEMSRILFEHGGTVDKFMGDGILAFFGDPFDQPDHAERGVRAALAMQARIAEMAPRWEEGADIKLKVRVGINSGKVIVGNLGTVTRIEYTVIGAAVNLAQRMESNAPLGGVLVTAETAGRLGDGFRLSPREVAVKGYEGAVGAFVVEC